jgi:AraC family transcriptional regulator, regulatory protein of adaptative response / methylated-DNA-[protein]-cysteine methyltransferase
MLRSNLPATDEMVRAYLASDTSYEGVFFTAVRTTGIFCRPSCPAKKPKPENVEFFATIREALAAGYRACERCRPLDSAGEPPAWLKSLLAEIEHDPDGRWHDADLRARAIEPERVRRWFKTHHGMTFHGYVRARRLGRALGRIRHGEDLTQAAYAHGYESVSGFREAFQRLFGETPGRSRSSRLLVFTRLLTPLGPMVAGASDEGLCLLEFADRPMLETQIRRLQKRLDAAIAPGENQHVAQVAVELKDYFAGRLREFRVPLCLPGTDFQREVWSALSLIPYGQTVTYQELARRVGRANAPRAAARANGDNRMSIIVPCHRVVGADGSLTGYGGGLWRKRLLLDHERNTLQPVAAASLSPSASERT